MQVALIYAHADLGSIERSAKAVRLPRTLSTVGKNRGRALRYGGENIPQCVITCEGIKQLYNGDRSEIIWTDADVGQLKAARPRPGQKDYLCPAEIAHAVDLDAHTGLRLGDLLRVSWSHVGDDAIIMTMGKSAAEK